MEKRCLLLLLIGVCVSYHAVHGKVVVLGLQLHSVGVVVADLRVACQEQTLVVHDPVEHLRQTDRKIGQINNSSGGEGTTFASNCRRSQVKTRQLAAGQPPRAICVLLQCAAHLSCFQARIWRNGRPLLREYPLRLSKRTTPGLWCPSNKLLLLQCIQDCSSLSSLSLSAAATCYFILLTQTSESQNVSVYFVLQLSLPEPSLWQPEEEGEEEEALYLCELALLHLLPLWLVEES